MSDRRNRLHRYTVTYAFSASSGVEHAEAISRIRETIAELRRDDVPIAFLGATVGVDDAVQRLTTTVRYEAPNMGTIGRLNCRARVPACGPPRREESDRTESDGIRHGQSAQRQNR